MGWWRGALALVAVLLPLACAAAPGRVALVIGNARYTQAVGPLANPVRDAELVATALRKRGFAVTAVSDASRVTLLAAVDRYARALAAAGPGAIGFFYYSGHGVANPDTHLNYLVPVDVASAADERLWYDSVPLDEVIRTVSRSAGGAANLIVFDACRDQLALPRGRGLGGGKGLERVLAPESTLIAYSTAPGRTAADVDATAANGPYATELAKSLATDGLNVVQMFEEVKYGVLQRTGDRQQPWVEDGLARRVWIGERVAATTPPRAADMEVETWALCRGAASAAPCVSYLKSFPGGRYAALAKTRLDDLAAGPARTPIAAAAVVATPAAVRPPPETVPGLGITLHALSDRAGLYVDEVAAAGSAFSLIFTGDVIVRINSAAPVAGRSPAGQIVAALRDGPAQLLVERGRTTTLVILRR